MTRHAPTGPATDGRRTSLRGRSAATSPIIAGCCLAMAAAAALLLLAGPAEPTLSGTLLTALPLVACVAAHLAMHRYMGGSCHTTTHEKEKDQ